MICPPAIRFIKLNAYISNWNDQADLYIHPEDIKCVTRKENRTIVYMENKDTWEVKETPEEIMGLLAFRNEVPSLYVREKDDSNI